MRYTIATVMEKEKRLINLYQLTPFDGALVPFGKAVFVGDIEYFHQFIGHKLENMNIPAAAPQAYKNLVLRQVIHFVAINEVAFVFQGNAVVSF